MQNFGTYQSINQKRLWMFHQCRTSQVSRKQLAKMCTRNRKHSAAEMLICQLASLEIHPVQVMLVLIIFHLQVLFTQGFLSRVSRDIDIANPSVRPSVRNVPVSDENSLTYHHIAKSFCFYQHQTSSRNSDGVTPCWGAKYRWGIKISRFSTNKSLYLANDAIYCHSYYRRRIGTRMRSIKWCHFQ